MLFLILTFSTGVLAACNKSSDSSNKTLKIGASISPHTEILEHIKPALKEKGVDLEIVSFDSDDELNPALDEKQIDANYFQHIPYLESVSKEKGYDFKWAGKIHIEPIGLYSNSISSLDDLKDGDKIGVPNNSSNEYRALKLLEDNGIIKLKDGLEDYSATPSDIIYNPKNLKIIEVDAAVLPRSLDSLAAAVINTNYVISAGIDTNSAIVIENSDSPYANIVAVRNGDQNNPKILALLKVLRSKEIADYINSEFKGAVKPTF